MFLLIELDYLFVFYVSCFFFCFIFFITSFCIKWIFTVWYFNSFNDFFHYSFLKVVFLRLSLRLIRIHVKLILTLLQWDIMLLFFLSVHICFWCLHVCLCAFCWKCGLTLAEQIYFHMYKFIFICIKVALFNLCHFIYWDFHIILVNLRNSLYHTLTIVIFVEIFSYPSYFTSRCRKLSFSFLLLQMFETS